MNKYWLLGMVLMGAVACSNTDGITVPTPMKSQRPSLFRQLAEQTYRRNAITPEKYLQLASAVSVPVLVSEPTTQLATEPWVVPEYQVPQPPPVFETDNWLSRWDKKPQATHATMQSWIKRNNLYDVINKYLSNGKQLQDYLIWNHPPKQHEQPIQWDR